MKYSEFKPTGFDCHIILDIDREDWLVVSTGQNRDSEPQDRANFDSALEILGGESETVEVHRFGHWANGWFEIILVHPSRESEVTQMEEALLYSFILDEEKVSEYELEEEGNAWNSYAANDFQKEIERNFQTNLEIDTDILFELFMKACDRDNLYVEHTCEGPHFPIERAVEQITFEDIEQYVDHSVTFFVEKRFTRQPKTVEELTNMVWVPWYISVFFWENDTGYDTITPPIIPRN
jgi:hypothetical protein|tara:strand:+ start:2599 stop:3309 length:711 start_codon:yes stop_codon:yes gene_type:complete